MLTFSRISANRELRGSLAGVISTGATGVTLMQKVWRNLQAFGNIAFAYGFSIILLEIQACSPASNSLFLCLTDHYCQSVVECHLVVA